MSARAIAINFLCASAAASCAAPEPPADDGPRVSIEIAALTLPDVADVCWDLRVTNGPGGGGEVVTTRGDRLVTAPADTQTLCADRFGDGRGAITYVAPCDAGSGQTNSVTLWLDSLWEVGATGPSTTHRDPCPNGCTLDVGCLPNADTRVSFDITVMRDARQGFFDVAVSFTDIFCSAKFDTCETNDPETALKLLFSEQGDRIPTGVLAFACSAGPGRDVEPYLHLAPVRLSCGGTGIVLDLGQVEASGNQPAVAGTIWAAYFGASPGGVPGADGRISYFNVAVAPPGPDCVVSWQATASSQPTLAASTGASGVAGSYFSYPIVETVAGPLTSGGAWVCGRHALDAPGSVVRTRYRATGGGTDLGDVLDGGGSTWTGGGKVSGTQDTVAPFASTLTAPSFGNYVTGQTLSFTATFSEPVFASGLRLPLLIDARTGLAAPAAGTTWPTSTVVFTYTVQAQDLAIDGIGLPDTFSGSYTDVAGNSGNLDLPALDVSGIRFNDAPLTLLAFTPPANDWYMEGEALEFFVTYNRAVDVDDSSASPTINLRLGAGTGTARQAVYRGGAESGVLRFVYELIDGDDDPDGINMAAATITLNGASITDPKPIDEGQTPDDAPLTFAMPNLAGIKVDTVTPTLTAVTKPTVGTYTLGQVLRATVTFSEPVVVTGTPTLELLIGATVAQAPLVSGSGTNTLTFEYVVAAGVSALPDDGPVELAELHLEGVTLRDQAGHDADVTTFVPASWTSVYVDGIAPPTILSVTGPADGDYITGDSLFFTVTFSEPVTIVAYAPTANAPPTRPALQLDIGGVTRYATLIDEGPGDTHVFEYALDTGDADNNGIAVSSPLVIQSASYPIRSEDYADKDAIRTFTPPDLSGVRVIDQTITDPVPLTWLKVPSNTYYRAGRVLSFTAYFDKAVTLAATNSTRPRIAVRIGNTVRYAESYYLSGRRSSLLMRLTVQDGEEDHDGIEILDTCIDLNGGTLTAAGNAPVDLCFTIPDTSGVKVDGRPAHVVDIIPPADGWTLVNQTLSFQVRFSEPVKVSYTPRLRLDVRTGATSTIRSARYVGGAYTDTLRFEYKVTSSDEDTDGVKLSPTGTPASPITLGTYTRIRDLGGNNAVRTWTTADHYPAVTVDGKVPTVTSVARAPSGTVYLQPGENADLLVNYGEAVLVTGTPRIRIVVGTSTRYAVYQPALSTATQLVFRYTVQTGDRDTNGISVYSPIELVGGTMRDAPGNDANLKLYSVTSMSGLRVGCSDAGSQLTRNGYTTLRTYSLTKPAGCTKMRFKIWGAGGGGSYSSSGGGGGFVSGKLDVSGATLIQVVLGVRGSGTTSTTTTTRSPGYDGRSGGWGRSYAGRGAGATALVVDGTPLAIIGGGGGGGMGGYDTTAAVHVARGGASNQDGGQSELFAPECLASSARGSAGTLGGGGSGGCAPDGSACGDAGTAAGLGGNGGSTTAARTGGGGGGGGWTGGGGGAGLCGNGGGGGLTHMVSDPRITLGVVEAGNNRLPGGVTDPNYNASYGSGGAGGSSRSGQYSRMVFFWE